MAVRIHMAAVLLLAAVGSTAIAQQVPDLANTGVSSDGTALLPQGTADPAWVITSPGGLSVTAFRFPDYFPNVTMGNPAGWISGIQGSAPVGSYTYQEQFTVAAADVYTFTGEWGVDNCGVISVDGAPVVGTGTSIGFASGACSGSDLSNFQMPTKFSFTASLAKGTNYIDFKVDNVFCGDACINPSALFVQFGKAMSAPEPGPLSLMGLGIGTLGLGLIRRKRRGEFRF